MKKILFAVAAMALFAACTPKADKTIENLKTAATGETNASAHYALYAQRALEEGDTNVYNMFSATSYAESRHAAKHLEELAKLGVADFVPQVAEITVGTTAENLATAIKGEIYEYTEMYPSFIEVAQQEKAKGAQVAFEWAMAAEKKHAAFYQQALDCINNPAVGDKGVSAEWYVCPKCGNTFNSTTFVNQPCEFCATPADQFQKFPKQ